jgi:hypothetical protein
MDGCNYRPCVNELPVTGLRITRWLTYGSALLAVWICTSTIIHDPSLRKVSWKSTQNLNVSITMRNFLSQPEHKASYRCDVGEPIMITKAAVQVLINSDAMRKSSCLSVSPVSEARQKCARCFESDRQGHRTASAYC